MSLHVGYRILLNWAETNVHSIKIGRNGSRTWSFLRTATSSNPKWANNLSAIWQGSKTQGFAETEIPIQIRVLETTRVVTLGKLPILRFLNQKTRGQTERDGKTQKVKLVYLPVLPGTKSWWAPSVFWHQKLSVSYEENLAFDVLQKAPSY